MIQTQPDVTEIGLEDVYRYKTYFLYKPYLKDLRNDADTARCDGDWIRGCVSI